MIRKIMLMVISLLMLSGLAAPFTLTQPVFAAETNILEEACTGKATDSPTCETTDPEANPLTGSDGILIRITQLIALIAGIAAVFIIIVSGMRYITSGGDTQKAVGARNALIGALVGLVIIALADVIIVAIIRGFL